MLPRRKEIERTLGLRKGSFTFRPHGFVSANDNDKARLILRLIESTGTSPARDIFFRPGLAAATIRDRLAQEAVLVLFQNQLKSLYINSLVIVPEAQEITLDWRQLCQDFLYDEFICRYHSKSLGSWAARSYAEYHSATIVLARYNSSFWHPSPL